MREKTLNGGEGMSEKTTNILIADDESEIRKILRLLLQKKGYDVCEAVNGAEAIERAREGVLKHLFPLIPLR